ncbi:MAG: TolC family protein [Gemmataceae bacterium]
MPDSFTAAASPIAPAAGAASPAAVAASTTAGTTSSAQLPAQEFYTDPALVGLINQALAGNQELKALNEEVQIASNEVLARRGAYLPTVGLEAGGGFERNSQFTPLGAAERQLEYLPGRNFPDPVPRVRLGAGLNWQIDIWRELRNARDAAIQRYYAAIERRSAFVTRLIADVADNYFGLLALDQRLTVLDQTIAIQEQSLELAVARKNAGRGTELAVQRFQAEVRKNQSEKLVVRQEIVEVENRINVLVGRFPQPVERTAGNFLDLTVPAVSVGLPAQLLANRPDIRRAERELAAAGLDVLVARARFFPRLDITAGVGWEAFNPRYLFDPGAFIANAAGGFVAPFVNRRAIQADYLTANARQLQALYNYQQVVLDAFREVVTQVSAAENYRTSIEIKQQQLQALVASVDAASQLFQNARAEYIEVLFAQRDLQDARTETVERKRRQLSAIVNAYQALGGGSNTITTLDPMSQQGPR